MREGYRLDPRGEHDLETLIAPNGERVAWVVRGSADAAIINSMIEEIEGRDVRTGAEKREALAEMAEEHYRLTTSRHQRFRDQQNKWVDYPIVKLLGIIAAIVAAVASVLALVRALQ